MGMLSILASLPGVQPVDVNLKFTTESLGGFSKRRLKEIFSSVEWSTVRKTLYKSDSSRSLTLIFRTLPEKPMSDVDKEIVSDGLASFGIEDFRLLQAFM